MKQRIDGWKNYHMFFGHIGQLLVDQPGKHLFSKTYGSEAVIPLEIGFPTPRTSLFTLDSND